MVGSDGTLYVGCTDSNLYAINPDGSLKWTYTGTGAFYTVPSLGRDGTIYAADYNGKVHAVNPDGSPKWVFSTGNYLANAVVVDADNTVYFLGYDFSVRAIDGPTGIQVWAHTITTGDGSFIGSPVITPAGNLLVLEDQGSLLSF